MSWEDKPETADVCGQFIADLAFFVGAKTIVEFGAHVGSTTEKLKDRCPNARIIAYERDNRLIAGLRERLPSVEVMNEHVLELPDLSVEVDFAFIDIDPKYVYEIAFRKLAIPKGGIVCAHDTCFHGDTGARGFPSFLRKNGYFVINFPMYYGLAVGMKK